MNKARLAILAVLLICSCKPKEPPTTTDTTTTGTTDTTATATAPTIEESLPPRFALEHFKFWKVRPRNDKPLEVTVMLKGQFDREQWKASLDLPQYLGNPVDKNKEGIQNKTLHLVAYAIHTDKQQPRTVLVKNQFAGSETWRLGQPAWLLVPADKKLDTRPGDPPRGDHFVCYAVEDAKAFEKHVTLSDQFDREKPEEIEKLEPAYFCVPVSKQREGKDPEPILDERTHLAIYRISPSSEIQKTVWTNDQFGPQELRVMTSEFLGVPSLKRLVQ